MGREGANEDGNEVKDGNGDGAGNGDGKGDRDRDGARMVTVRGMRTGTKKRVAAKTETGTGVLPGAKMETGTGTGAELKCRLRGGGRELGNPPHQNRSKVSDQAQLFGTWL